jgi:excisionase family DNA binding protein
MQNHIYYGMGSSQRMNLMNDDRLVDLEWLSELLGVPGRTIYSWRQYGEGPPAYRVGRYLRYRRSDVEAWLNERHDTEDQHLGSKRRS